MSCDSSNFRSCNIENDFDSDTTLYFLSFFLSFDPHTSSIRTNVQPRFTLSWLVIVVAFAISMVSFLLLLIVCKRPSLYFEVCCYVWHSLVHWVCIRKL